MATPIKMPDLGTNTEEIRLVAWLKQEGDSVKRGDPLCEVETDKATDQLESVAEGVLLRQMVAADSAIQTGSIIAYIGQPGESVAESPVEQPAAERTMAAPAAASAGATSVKVAPVVRNLALREGVDLANVVGTGAGGQITREDVLKAKQATASPLKTEGVPLAKEQLAVARQVARSNREIPTIDLVATVDMSVVMRGRGELSEKCSTKASYDSFFLFAVAQAMSKHRRFAGHGGDEQFYPHDSIDICLAVSREDRLYLPVLRSVDQRTLIEIDAEVRRLAERTRSGQLRPDELAGGCFTISNLGMYGLESFQMIIPPQQSGALAIGAVRDGAIVDKGQIVVRPVATITLSVDHRIINGAEAAEFLQHVKDTLTTL